MPGDHKTYKKNKKGKNIELPIGKLADTGLDFCNESITHAPCIDVVFNFLFEHKTPNSSRVENLPLTSVVSFIHLFYSVERLVQILPTKAVHLELNK